LDPTFKVMGVRISANKLMEVAELKKTQAATKQYSV
jgi:hypothetical protein